MAAVPETQPSDGKLHVMIVGLTGVGKSTLGNKLVGDVADAPFVTRAGLEQTTLTITAATGPKFKVYDTQGFGHVANRSIGDAQLVMWLAAEMTRRAAELDAVVWMVNFASERATDADYSAIKLLNQFLEATVMRHLVVVINGNSCGTADYGSEYAKQVARQQMRGIAETLRIPEPPVVQVRIMHTAAEVRSIVEGACAHVADRTRFRLGWSPMVCAKCGLIGSAACADYPARFKCHPAFRAKNGVIVSFVGTVASGAFQGAAATGGFTAGMVAGSAEGMWDMSCACMSVGFFPDPDLIAATGGPIAAIAGCIVLAVMLGYGLYRGVQFASHATERAKEITVDLPSIFSDPLICITCGRTMGTRGCTAVGPESKCMHTLQPPASLDVQAVPRRILDQARRAAHNDDDDGGAVGASTAPAHQ